MRQDWRIAVGIIAMLGLASAAGVKEGAKAPAFEAQDQHGATIRLADFQGKAAVVLYFYPKDDTPGCTDQACSLRDGHAALKAAGAVILPLEPATLRRLRGLTDSKKLSAAERARFAGLIRKVAVCYAVGWADAIEIDRLGIVPATRLAMRRAIGGLRTPPSGRS